MIGIVDLSVLPPARRTSAERRPAAAHQRHRRPTPRRLPPHRARGIQLEPVAVSRRTYFPARPSRGSRSRTSRRTGPGCAVSVNRGGPLLRLPERKAIRRPDRVSGQALVRRQRSAEVPSGPRIRCWSSRRSRRRLLDQFPSGIGPDSNDADASEPSRCSPAAGSRSKSAETVRNPDEQIASSRPRVCPGAELARPSPAGRLRRSTSVDMWSTVPMRRQRAGAGRVFACVRSRSTRDCLIHGCVGSVS